MKKKIIFTILAIILIIVGFAGWKVLGPTLHSPEKKYVYVSTGSDYEKLTKTLIDSNIIAGRTWFDWTSKSLSFNSVKPGRYEIKTGMSLMGLVRMLKNGQQEPVNFVITKLRTKESLAARIGKAFECDSTQMINFLNNQDSLSAYSLDTNTAMVVALPLTYPLKWNTTPGKIYQQFYTAYKAFWTPGRKAKADSMHLSQTEISTLASIIDEETNSKTDKPNVASVYLNRIAKGMPLQADPTVKFAMKNFSLRRIYTDYTKFQSPYNTYINKGLPPGPICTPSEETIDAVLASPKTDYIYFVASPAFDGTHVFTTNYADHMKQAKIYQQELNKRNIR